MERMTCEYAIAHETHNSPGNICGSEETEHIDGMWLCYSHATAIFGKG